MKKVSLFLAVLLVLTCCLLASCGGEGDDASSAETSSAATSSEKASSEDKTSSAAASSEESSVEEPSSEPEESSEPEPSESETSSEEPSTGYDGPIEENPDGANLALNKSYTGANPSTHDSVKQYNANLTDGKAKDSLSYDGEWFAYYYNKDAVGDVVNAPDRVGTLVIDLEKVYAVSDVKINTYLGNTGDGILPPSSIAVEYSTDGTNYSKLGEQSFEAPDATLKDKTVKWVEFKADKAVAAQYIRVTFAVPGTFAFINEVEVH